MDNIKNDDYYLNRIITDITFIVNHMKNVDLQELHDNEILLDSMLFRMIQISENAKRLSSDYRDANSNLPWDEISGLRNRIVHDYGNVNLYIIYDTLKNDIPDLLVQLSREETL